MPPPPASPQWPPFFPGQLRFERSAQSAADETGLSTAQSIFVALGAAAALCCLICCCAAAAAARRKKGEQGDIEAPGASAAGGAKTKPLWQRFDDPATMPKSQQGLQTYHDGPARGRVSSAAHIVRERISSVHKYARDMSSVAAAYLAERATASTKGGNKRTKSTREKKYKNTFGSSQSTGDVIATQHGAKAADARKRAAEAETAMLKGRGKGSTGVERERSRPREDQNALQSTYM